MCRTEEEKAPELLLLLVLLYCSCSSCLEDEDEPTRRRHQPYLLLLTVPQRGGGNFRFLKLLSAGTARLLIGDQAFRATLAIYVAARKDRHELGSLGGSLGACRADCTGEDRHELGSLGGCRADCTGGARIDTNWHVAAPEDRHELGGNFYVGQEGQCGETVVVWVSYNGEEKEYEKVLAIFCPRDPRARAWAPYLTTNEESCR